MKSITTRTRISAALLALLLLLSLCACGSGATATSATATPSAAPTAAPTPTAEPVVITGDCFADIVVEGYGSITVKLDAEAAPLTVANFVALAESGFYDGLTFHRIMTGFMIQGGDPLGTGRGGSDTKIKGEFSENGVQNPISHTRGVISMARAQANDSASSQFFIVHEDSTFLDGKYAAFGCVTEGMEVVDAICADARPTDNNGTIPAAQQPVITSVTIRR